MADFDGAKLKEILTNRHILNMLSHLLLVLWAVVDKCIKEEHAVLEHFEEELVAAGDCLYLHQVVPVILEDVHDLLLRVHVVQDYLPLQVYLTLQACQRVKRSPSFFAEAVDQQLEDGPQAIDEVEHD